MRPNNQEKVDDELAIEAVERILGSVINKQYDNIERQKPSNDERNPQHTPFCKQRDSTILQKRQR